MEPKQLRQPPITEALVDLRVELPEDVQLSTLATFQDAIRTKYPNRQERLTLSGEVTLIPGVAATGPIPQVHGYLFKSADGKYVVQARLDGFSFSILPPYVSWDLARDEVFSLWHHYVAIARPIKVTRVAMRYINHIKLPASINHIREYLLSYPHVAQSLPNEISEFFMRVVLQEDGRQAILTIATQISNQTSRILLLDVDAFKIADFSINNEDIWKCLESLRKLKNKVFFGCLTDTALEPYV